MYLEDILHQKTQKFFFWVPFDEMRVSGSKVNISQVQYTQLERVFDREGQATNVASTLYNPTFRKSEFSSWLLFLSIKMKKASPIQWRFWNGVFFFSALLMPRNSWFSFYNVFFFLKGAQVVGSMEKKTI